MYTYVCGCKIRLEYPRTIDNDRNSKCNTFFSYYLSYVFHGREYQISVRGQQQVFDSIKILKKLIKQNNIDTYRCTFL